MESPGKPVMATWKRREPMDDNELGPEVGRSPSEAALAKSRAAVRMMPTQPSHDAHRTVGGNVVEDLDDTSGLGNEGAEVCARAECAALVVKSAKCLPWAESLCAACGNGRSGAEGERDFLPALGGGPAMQKHVIPLVLLYHMLEVLSFLLHIHTHTHTHVFTPGVPHTLPVQVTLTPEQRRRRPSLMEDAVDESSGSTSLAPPAHLFANVRREIKTLDSIQSRNDAEDEEEDKGVSAPVKTSFFDKFRGFFKSDEEVARDVAAKEVRVHTIRWAAE